MSFSRSARKTGSDWTCRVLFYSRTDRNLGRYKVPVITRDWLLRGGDNEISGLKQQDEDSDGYEFLIENDALQDTMDLLIDGSEMIENIWVFKCPLFFWQFSQLFLCHQFVVMKTAKWWWSIEKNSGEILIQRSKHFAYTDQGVVKYGVRDCDKLSRRETPLRRVSSDIGQKSMEDLIEFLFRGNELKKKYELDVNNCKHFAKRVFDAFSQRKYHHIGFGCDPDGDEIDLKVTNLVFWRDLIKGIYKLSASCNSECGGYLIIGDTT